MTLDLDTALMQLTLRRAQGLTRGLSANDVTALIHAALDAARVDELEPLLQGRDLEHLLNLGPFRTGPSRHGPATPLRVDAPMPFPGREVAVTALVGQVLRRDGGTLARWCENPRSVIGDDLADALALDAAWLETHARGGRVPGDRVLLRAARPETFSGDDVARLTALGRGARGRTYAWDDLLAHPALPERERRRLVKEARSNRHFGAGLTQRDDLSDDDLLALLSPHPALWAASSQLPRVLDALLDGAAARGERVPRELLEHPGLSDAQARRVLDTLWHQAGRTRGLSELLRALPSPLPAARAAQVLELARDHLPPHSVIGDLASALLQVLLRPDLDIRIRDEPPRPAPTETP